MLVNMPVAEYWGRGSVRVSGVLVQPDMVEEGKYHVEEEEEKCQVEEEEKRGSFKIAKRLSDFYSLP